MQAQRLSIFSELNQLQDFWHIQEMLILATHNLEEIDRQIESLRIQREQTAFSAESILRNMLASIEEQEKQLEMLKFEIDIAEESLRQTTILHSLGLRSANDLRLATQRTTQINLQQQEHERNMYNLRQSLNLLLGQPGSQSTLVVFEITLPEPPESLNRHITQSVAQSPSIRQSQISVARARADLQFFETQLRTNQHYHFLSPTTEERATRISLEEAYTRAVNSHNQEVTTMETALRQAFNDLENLATRKESQTIELENARQNLENIQTNFSLGRATQFDVKQAEFAILTATQNIERTVMQQWLLVYAVQ
jgi:outer membrane protein TolC